MNRLPPQGSSAQNPSLHWYTIDEWKDGAIYPPQALVHVALVLIADHNGGWQVLDGSRVVAEGLSANPRQAAALHAADYHEVTYPKAWVAFQYGLRTENSPGKLVWLIQSALQKAPIDAYPEFLLN